MKRNACATILLLLCAVAISGCKTGGPVLCPEPAKVRLGPTPEKPRPIRDCGGWGSWPRRRGAAAPSRNSAQNADFTTPPSTRSAAPVVAADSGLAT